MSEKALPICTSPTPHPKGCGINPTDAPAFRLGAGETAEKVCVLGLWHLGSVAAACLAELGYTVVGVDLDAQRVRRLQRGRAPLFEPGLDDVLAKHVKAGRLSFTANFSAARNARYVISAFDTPVNDEDEVDTAPLFDAFAALAEHLQHGTTVIVSSQVPVGTCERLAALIATANPGLRFGLAYCPENLRLGQAIQRFLQPDFIVIGADDEATLDEVETFWSVIEAPKLRMQLRSAEMTKHALNCFLATSISFANEIANFCDEVGADALQVTEALRLDQRIGPKAMLAPGLGFGGGHLARDLKVLKGLGESQRLETPLIDGVLRVNASRNGLVLRKLQQAYGSLQGLKVAVFGLTYKPGTSTLHRSPALEIIAALRTAGAEVSAYDPKADPEELRERLPTVQAGSGFQFFPDPYEAVAASDALVIITDWREFRDLDFQRLASAMRRPLMLDMRNLLDPQAVSEAGFTYLGVGRTWLPARQERAAEAARA